jgi:hypothetical protein
VLGYLDPGSGSVLLGVVAGGVAGAGVMAKSAMLRLRGGKKGKAADQAEVDVDAEAADDATSTDA